VSGIRARLARGGRRLFGRYALRRLSSWPVIAALVCLALIAALGYRAAHRETPVDDTVGDVPRVGPVDGERVDAYLRRSRSELAGLVAGRPVWALVEFAGYQRPAGLTPLLVGYPVGRVLARVPLPGVQTQLVTLVVNTLSTDVPAGMRRVATAKEQAAANLAGTTGGSSEVASVDAAVERREAAAYRQLCACLYAAVVRADPAGLRTLAGRAGVRVVDPAPEVSRLDRATFVPLLPEQREIVGPPGDTASASPTSTAG
jgi:hypothetical protein